MARRMAISFCRAVARPSKRLATLVQEISSTSPTMAIRIDNVFENSLGKPKTIPLAADETSSRVERRSLCSVGDKPFVGMPPRTSRWMTARSARACSRPIPGLSLPMILNQL